METLFVALRVLLSLGAVLALLWLLQRRFARGAVGAKGKARNAASLAVVGRQSVGAKASVVVVEHDGHRLLLGVTEHGVTVLHTAEMAQDAAPATDPAEPYELHETDEQGHARFAQVLAEAGQPEELLTPSPITGLSASTTQTRATTQTPAATPPAGRLAGSILAPETWKQAAAAVRDRW
ncbi:flagellar biosynthetic protein FliO [Microterricola viridarii]|uniref:Flagellar protein n=1 Tax=Microterricola viridarii TaxID=412690 RepID=A0A120I0C0_9MICO|nr:flagellar biosynthetic protein FliO [Microterricola viridarii]AMB58742.1 hypothetical protein AWU67_07570 [Microterricola viridarii]